jgi:hypothetical protein
MTAPRKLSFGAHLTQDELNHPAARTYIGQAHFAGSGPAGKTCRECCFWVPAPGTTKHAYDQSGIKAHRCTKRASMMRSKDAQLVPPKASACKYFEPPESPPPQRQKF